MTPEDPGFHEILYSAPPPDLNPSDNGNVLNFVVGVDGLPRAVSNDRELEEYLWGGEYDEMMAISGEEESLIIEGL